MYLDGVNSLARPGCQVGFSEGLAAGWVSVTYTGNILTAGSVLHCQGSLVDHLTGTWANNVGAKKAVSLLIPKNFYKAISFVVTFCSTVCCKWEFTRHRRCPALCKLALDTLRDTRELSLAALCSRCPSRRALQPAAAAYPPSVPPSSQPEYAVFAAATSVEASNLQNPPASTTPKAAPRLSSRLTKRKHRILKQPLGGTQRHARLPASTSRANGRAARARGTGAGGARGHSARWLH